MRGTIQSELVTNGRPKPLPTGRESTVIFLHQGAGKEATDDVYASRVREQREARMRLELFVNTSDILMLFSPIPSPESPGYICSR